MSTSLGSYSGEPLSISISDRALRDLSAIRMGRRPDLWSKAWMNATAYFSTQVSDGIELDRKGMDEYVQDPAD
jgi:hypothetical protein